MRDGAADALAPVRSVRRGRARAGGRPLRRRHRLRGPRGRERRLRARLAEPRAGLGETPRPSGSSARPWPCSTSRGLGDVPTVGGPGGAARRSPTSSRPSSSTGAATGIGRACPWWPPTGLVGRVVDVSKTRSTVQLVTDPTVVGGRAAHRLGRRRRRRRRGAGADLCRSSFVETSTKVERQASWWSPAASRAAPSRPASRWATCAPGRHRPGRCRAGDRRRAGGRPRPTSRSCGSCSGAPDDRSAEPSLSPAPPPAAPAGRRGGRAPAAAAPSCGSSGSPPDLMLALAVAAGLAGGPERGAWVGFAAGLLADCFLQTPLGLSALVYGSSATASASSGPASSRRRGGSRCRSPLRGQRRRRACCSRRSGAVLGQDRPGLRPAGLIVAVVGVAQRRRSPGPASRPSPAGRCAARSASAGAGWHGPGERRTTRASGWGSSASSSLSLFAALLGPALVPPGPGRPRVPGGGRATTACGSSPTGRPGAGSSTATARCWSTTGSSDVVAIDRPVVDEAERPEVLDRLAACSATSRRRRSTSAWRTSGPARTSPCRWPRTSPEETLIHLREHQADFPGVDVAQRWPCARYPNGSLAAHVLGYVGEINDEELTPRRATPYRAGDTIGKAGVELAYESDLRGAGRSRSCSRSTPTGQVLRSLGRARRCPGHDVRAALDADVQRLAEEALAARAWRRPAHGLRPDDRQAPRRRRRGGGGARPARRGGRWPWRRTRPTTPPSSSTAVSRPRLTSLFGRADRPSPHQPGRSRACTPPARRSSWSPPLAALGRGAHHPRHDDQRPRHLHHPRVPTAGAIAATPAAPPTASVDLRRALTVSSDVYFYTSGDELLRAGARSARRRIQDMAGRSGFGEPTGDRRCPSRRGPGARPRASRAALHADNPEAFPERRVVHRRQRQPGHRPGRPGRHAHAAGQRLRHLRQRRHPVRPDTGAAGAAARTAPWCGPSPPRVGGHGRRCPTRCRGARSLDGLRARTSATRGHRHRRLRRLFPLRPVPGGGQDGHGRGPAQAGHRPVRRLRPRSSDPRYVGDRGHGAGRLRGRRRPRPVARRVLGRGLGRARAGRPVGRAARRATDCVAGAVGRKRARGPGAVAASSTSALARGSALPVAGLGPARWSIGATRSEARGGRARPRRFLKRQLAVPGPRRRGAMVGRRRWSTTAGSARPGAGPLRGSASPRAAGGRLSPLGTTSTAPRSWFEFGPSSSSRPSWPRWPLIVALAA